MTEYKIVNEDEMVDSEDDLVEFECAVDWIERMPSGEKYYIDATLETKCVKLQLHGNNVKKSEALLNVNNKVKVRGKTIGRWRKENGFVCAVLVDQAILIDGSFHVEDRGRESDQSKKPSLFDSAEELLFWKMFHRNCALIPQRQLSWPPYYRPDFTMFDDDGNVVAFIEIDGTQHEESFCSDIRRDHLIEKNEGARVYRVSAEWVRNLAERLGVSA